MKYSKILIDGNNVYHRFYCVNNGMKTKLKGTDVQLKTGGIYGSIKYLQSIDKYLSNLSNSRVYILFDNFSTRISNRKEIDPEYKSNRERRNPAYYRGIEYLQLILLSYSNKYSLIYRSNYEADDLCKPLIETFPKDDFILVVSDDQDWARLIDYNKRNVNWLFQREVYDKYAFNKRYGYYPSANKIILYKTIRGDTSDNIPVGLPYLPENILLQLLNDYENIYQVLNNLNDIDYLHKEWRQKFNSCKNRLMLNNDLVEYLNIPENEIFSYIYNCKFNKLALILLYNALGFKISKIDNRCVENQEKDVVQTFINREKIKRM